MEYCTNIELGFLEELLGLKEEMGYYVAAQDFNNNSSNNIMSTALDCFSDNLNIPSTTTNSTCFEDNYFNFPIHDQSLMTLQAPFGDELSPPEFTADSSSTMLDSQTFPYCYYQEDNNKYYCSVSNILDDEDVAAAAARHTLFGDGVHQDPGIGAPCKPEPVPVPQLPTTFNMGSYFPAAGILSSEKKSKSKKLNGQPSKNLMAERRRRKRLNDRLSMLRSVVPKISKMDRTSILGDTIDYMRELLERINSLQDEMDVGSSDHQLSLMMSIFKDVKPNESLVRNSPKFEVERRERDTRIEVCCGGKPGLLLSTVTTLEALGLEIQQCVISCFNDFGMQASCSEGLKERSILDSEDIKQALLRNAGYGGRCL